MNFQRVEPAPGLSQIIECYWTAEDEDATRKHEKIIPDGFTEIIFHFGDPYRINLNKKWETQSLSLIAGQINRHFFLENTGRSAILGIKMKPVALTRLFSVLMSSFTDRVLDLHTVPAIKLSAMEGEIREAKAMKDRISILDAAFIKLNLSKENGPIDTAVDYIMANHGMVTVAVVGEVAGVGERQLENLFRRYIGLTPKRFARIFRFNYIFKLIRQRPMNWSDLAYEAAYYDQSHFIRNFKDFTGENPGDYAFDEKNMANFFLKKGYN